MRRPIFIIGVTLAAAIFIYLYCKPLPVPDIGEAEGSILTLIGQVEKKDYHISNSQEVPVIYLRNIQVVNSSNTNYLTDYQTKGLKIEDLYAENTWLTGVNGVLCYITEGKDPKIGSYICVRGKLRSFNKATNPGEFDAAGYYGILNLQARLNNGVILGESRDYDRFKEGLYRIKRYLRELLDYCYDEEDASVMKAMLLGEKSTLDEDIKQLYQLNGIIHILSISGLHISIIGMGLFKLLNRLKVPKPINIPISVFLIYCYGIMSGMSVSTYRAVVMFGLHIAAELFGRTYDMLTATAIACILILFGQPMYINHSGFLFSFGAILAIGLLNPIVKEQFPVGGKISEVMSTTVSISIAALPIYLCFYYEYPVYSMILNLIVIPGTGLIVSDGLITCAAAAIFLPLGKYAALPSHILLSICEMCCKLAISLPFSRNIMGAPKPWQVLIYLSIICIAAFYGKRCSKLMFWQFILSALLCISIRFQDGLQLTFIDVGQGDGIYIAEDSGRRFLIDGGSSDKSNVGTYQILPFLKEEGADTLTAVFVTHMDSDHYNGIRELIENMDKNGVQIENLILPDIGEQSRDDEYHALENLAVNMGINLRYIHEGDVLRLGKLKFTCLHPVKGENSDDTNSLSMVLFLEYEDFTALFTGDLEGAGEEAVIKRLEKYITSHASDENISDAHISDSHIFEEIHITLLKVAHHGSRNSTTQDFLEFVSPRAAVISAGRNNRYGHPHEETLFRLEKAGCRIFKTNEGGAVTVKFRKGRVRVKCFCN